MPYQRPRRMMQQDAYNWQKQQAYSATNRVPPPQPATVPAPDPVADIQRLAKLHDSGALSDAEFAAAKAKVVGLTAE
jgi:hypothetical protein